MTTLQTNNKLIIANCSGFFGDRFSAAREMVTGGHIHVLTGDYLAELTMALLFQKKAQGSEQRICKDLLGSDEGGHVPLS